MSDQAQQNATKYSTLTPTQRVYAVARARGLTVIEASEKASINRSTPLRWDADLINAAILELQQELFSDAAKAVEHIVPLAIAELEKAVTEGDMQAIKEVMNRRFGMPTQRQEITGKDRGPIEMVAAEPNYRNDLGAIAPLADEVQA